MSTTGPNYMTVTEVAERLRCKPRTIYELTRFSEIPHRPLPGGRRCLFIAEELAAWEEGAALEEIPLPRGGRIVRPKVVV